MIHLGFILSGWAGLMKRVGRHQQVPHNWNNRYYSPVVNYHVESFEYITQRRKGIFSYRISRNVTRMNDGKR